MTTKNDFISFVSKRSNGVRKFGDQNSQFGNLNLNQSNNKSLDKQSFGQTKSKSNDKNNTQSFVLQNQHEKKEVSETWKNKNSFKTLNFNKDSEDQKEKRWKNDSKNSNAKNASTLSLHIAAYENSVEAAASDASEDSAKEINKSLKFALKVQDSFEFPRQSHPEKQRPEVMQFKTSQKLFNPNETLKNYEELKLALENTLLTLGLNDDEDEFHTSVASMTSEVPDVDRAFEVSTLVDRTSIDRSSVPNAPPLDISVFSLGADDDEEGANLNGGSTVKKQSTSQPSVNRNSVPDAPPLDISMFSLGTDDDGNDACLEGPTPVHRVSVNQNSVPDAPPLDISLFSLGADDDENVTPEKEPYSQPSFNLPAETSNPSFTLGSGFNSLTKRPPFGFFTPRGSVTVNAIYGTQTQPFKGRCYTTSGNSISHKSFMESTFNETTELDTSDTTFLSWGSRGSKSSNNPGTGVPSRAPFDFVPKVRALSKINEDDAKSANEYEKIHAFEEPLTIHGISSLITVDNWEMAEFPHVLLQNIYDSMYSKPRQIQRTAIPLILDRMDVLVCSETGCGKTAAFLIPIIAKCIESKAQKSFISGPSTPFAVIIGPTRELIHQSFEQSLKFTQNTGVTTAKLYGEYAVRSNAQELWNGCDLLFTTPGRLQHFLKDGFINLQKIQFFVFDEADTILGNSFMEDIEPVFKHPKFARRGSYQTLFFSATFGEYMIRAATRYMRRKWATSIFSKKCATNKLCLQDFQRVPKEDRLEALKEFLNNKLAEGDTNSSKLPQILIFVNTQLLCDQLAEELRQAGFGAISIRGNSAQNRRLEAFETFRDKTYPILISTDLLSKGIDIKDIDLVLNYELPYYVNSYIYRVGRVGRIKEGNCLSFVDPNLNKHLVRDILKVLQVANHPVSSIFDELVEESERIIEEGDDPADGFDVFFGAESTAELGLSVF